MGIIAVTIGVIFLILAILWNYPTLEAIVFMIGIIVANVPEGLLPQMTVALTITAQRMRDKEVVVTNLEIIESLGAVNVICSDKTGTLTCNRMTAVHLCYDKEIFTTPITQNMDSDTFAEFDKTNISFQELLHNVFLNTDARFTPREDGTYDEDVLKRDTVGDASEVALIKFAQALHDIEDVRAQNKRIFGVPFNSSNKWMCSISANLIEGVPQPNLMMYLKGAPEKILAKCDKYLYKGEILPMDEKTHKEFEQINDTLARRGERVLGFAQLQMSKDYNDVDYTPDYPFSDDPKLNFETDGLVFVGFFALIDPPRKGVKQAIGECHIAGIKVFMVTGDHPTTAHAIAKSLNLITGDTLEEMTEKGITLPEGEKPKSIVIKGTDLLDFDDEKWDFVLSHEEIVFARTMPQQKQDIVTHLSKLDYIIAMTGDGVNDAPALKAAHVGIAMGSGAAVAKEAGQIILMNDNFTSIVDGIREGRLIFENLKKCICYVLTSNIPELIPFLLFIIIKIPLSIETIMIILIDIGTDIVPAIALAYEEPEDMIMQIPPRSRDSHLVGLKLMCMAYLVYGTIQTFTAYFAWAYVFYDYGFTIDTLVGAGVNYRDSWNSTLNNTERREFFSSMCQHNSYYQINMVPQGKNCEQDFKDYLVFILGIAQSAFLLTIVWTQIACIFIRKTQVASVFNAYRLSSNKAIYYGILSELCLIVLFVYCPGFNNALLLAHVPAKYASTALWGIPFFILFDELRKLICRIEPKYEYFGGREGTGCLTATTCF